jgi:3-hydroxyisobutyrate dehydrogenase-like beta-hydroxyacid dehydrogenase
MTLAPGLATGVIGLGNMGRRIACRIRDAGRPVRGYDRNEGRAAEHGIPEAASIADLCAGAGLVLLSLPDSAAVEEVVLGRGGVLENVRPGRLVVDLSTAAPSSSRRLHAALGEFDVAFVDAGVSGGPRAAENGTLTIMAGGAADAIMDASPVLADISARIVHMGPPGAGHAAKLLNNFLNASSLAATAEAMVAGQRAGLDLERLLDVINHSSGMSYATRERFAHILEGDYLEGGLTTALMAKDVQLYLDYVQEIEAPSYTGPSCLKVFELACALGYADEVSNRVVDAIGDTAGGVRIQRARHADQ